ncbi:MAG TPA: J domain-containing protein [Acidobacteriaceae bacterium]|nr:J domain-containing protein [Acidobacteriaceae bacterium]
MHSGFEAKSGAQAGWSWTDGLRRRPSRFVEHMQQLFGDEPDPVFLEESWRLGVARATENMQRRRLQQMDRENELRNCALRELGRIASLRGRRDAVSEAEELGWKSSTWAPADWTPEEQVAQRALPHGWMPADVPPTDEFVREAARGPEGGAMTLARAEEMLGVSADCSREEIRSAYRKMVGVCHPDKFQHAAEAVRARATQALAEANEAYRLLCEELVEAA